MGGEGGGAPCPCSGGRERASFPPGATFHTLGTPGASPSHPTPPEGLGVRDQAQGPVHTRRGQAGSSARRPLCLCPGPRLFGPHLQPSAEPQPIPPPGPGCLEGQTRDRQTERRLVPALIPPGWASILSSLSSQLISFPPGKQRQRPWNLGPFPCQNSSDPVNP